MPQILTAIYLIAMLAAGWRLFSLGWTRTTKLAASVAIVAPIPLLILLPALLNPERPFADLLHAIGLALLACGALSLTGGFSAAWLRARRK